MQNLSRSLASMKLTKAYLHLQKLSQHSLGLRLDGQKNEEKDDSPNITLIRKINAQIQKVQRTRYNSMDE